MNFRLAEIGIILIACSSAPFFGWWFHVIFSIFPFVGQQILVEGFFCAITIIGLLLLILDTKGFLRRRKNNGKLSAFLIILGFILLISSSLMVYTDKVFWSYEIGKGRSVSSEELTLYMLSISWGTLVFFSSLSWLIYGFVIAAMLSTKTGFQPQPQKKIDFEEPWTKPSENLLVKYVERYPHNPEGVLEWHIHKKMKEGKTREQAIQELNK